MTALGRMDWPVFYLYNGALLEEDGECAIAIPRLFHSVEDAEQWLKDKDIRGNVVKAIRKGNRLYAA